MSGITDPGIPSYVGVTGPPNGYVKRGYQKYYSSNTLLTPGDPNWVPPGTPPQQGVPFVPATSSGGSGSPLPPPPAPPGTAYSIPPVPPNWPTLPPTIPPMTCPPLNSTWSAGPPDISGDQVGYTPPVANPNDDGLTFPISLSDVALANSWHGVASTLNPLNIQLYQLQLDLVVEQAVRSANQTKDVTFPSVGGQASGTYTISGRTDFFAIQVAVETAVLKAMLQGTGLWYELVLKPLTNGPFENYYVVGTTELLLPMTVNLAAPST